MASGQFNSLPNFPVPLMENRITSRDWYRFFVGLFRGLPPANVEPVTLTGSPYVYSATRKGSLIVEGGTVSAVEFSRDGGDTYIDVGTVAGMFTLNASDLLRLTYAVDPNVNFVPT